jgi:hypothetical protein
VTANATWSSSASGAPIEAFIRWPWWISFGGVFSSSLRQPPLAAPSPRVAETRRSSRRSAQRSQRCGRRGLVGRRLLRVGGGAGTAGGRGALPSVPGVVGAEAAEPRKAAVGAGGSGRPPVPSVPGMVGRGEQRDSSGGRGRGVAAYEDAGGGRK